MDLNLTGKTAFISGSTSGIGFATAKALLTEGANVIINGRTAKSVKTALNALTKAFPDANIQGLAADFSKPSDVEILLPQIQEVDILINNVGIYYPSEFLDSSDDEWISQFEVNVMSGVRLCRTVLPQLLERQWGRILFISSECATLVPADLIPYSVTKGALHTLSQGLAQLTKGSNVTVNTIIPGSTLSEGAKRFLSDVASKEGKTTSEVETDFFTDVRTSSLLQRFASVEEVASTITYYCSPLAGATNGALIRVDGGSMGF